jgi:uncharacterized metal-binding protein YceD (DUF177 family)
MRINLLEIPEEGKLFVCNQQTGELNEVLKDLIGKTPYQSEFFIRPMSSGTFELKGFIRTETAEQCSRCGLDFQLKIDEAFTELLMPDLEQPRDAKYAKANHISDMADSGPSVYEYTGHHFLAGEYLHGVIALAQPFTPCPPKNSKGDCSVCLKPVDEKPFTYEDEGFDGPRSPFAALKNIKIQ